MATEPKTSGRVCVACKLPHGLRIQFYDTSNPTIPPVLVDDPISLVGSNDPHAVGGYGITQNVDAARMSKWLADNARYPAVRQGLIFVEDTYDRARARAQEQAAIASGFEGLNAEAPPGGVQVDNYENRPKSAQ